mmetsp:Transcript_22035/g.61701  ORF Transcript_22035/g.61701 Transcript_22035/m.61701 type:complete len:410 (+) Transcript_22035:66-1295(+)
MPRRGGALCGVALAGLIAVSSRETPPSSGSRPRSVYAVWYRHACSFEGLRDGSMSRGDVWAGYVPGTSSSQACEQSCREEAECVSFMFRRTTAECWLYRVRPQPAPSTDFDCGRLALGPTYHEGDSVLLEDGSRQITVDDVAFGYELLTNIHGLDARLFGVRTAQDPLTLALLQEHVWDLRPDLIVELGTECGGLSSILAELQQLRGLDNSLVITVDIAPHGYAPWSQEDCQRRRGNSELWDRHVVARRIWPVLRNTARWGCPCDGGVVSAGPQCACMEDDGALASYVARAAEDAQVVLVIDDASHFKNDVIANFELLAPFVTAGSLYIVADSRLDRLCETVKRLGYVVPNGFNPGEQVRCDYYVENGPAAAVDELARRSALFQQRFFVDRAAERTMLNAHPGGWLRAV